MNVTMPDGTIIQGVPDDATREQVLTKWKANGGVMPGEATPPDKLGVAKAGATGAIKGLIAATAGAPGDLADVGQLAANKLGLVDPPTGTGFFPRSHEIFKTLPDMHTPANTQEKVVEGAASGAASTVNPFALVGKGKLFGKGLALLGGVGGGGGELAAEAFPEHPDMARALAFLAALSPAGYLGARKPNVVKATQDYVNEVRPQGLKEAQANRSAAADTLGTPTILSQGTPGETALSGITQELKATPQGAQIRRILEAQPTVGRAKIDEMVAALSKEPVGQNTANDVLTAADWAPKPKSDGAFRVSFPQKMIDSGVGKYDTMGKVLREPSKFGPSDIAEVARTLTESDATAFPNLVKQRFSEAREASLTPREGRLQPTAVGDFATDVAGSIPSRQRENFRETMKQVAIAQGADPAMTVKGAEALIDALHTISRDQGGVGLSGQFQQQAGANVFSMGMKSANLIAPMQGIGRAVERAVYKNTYAKLADALTSPDGVRKLMAIANYSRPLEAAVTTARGLLATDADVQAQR